MENQSNIQIVSCSGASNTGKYTDDVARRLAAAGHATLICLAKVAIGDEPLIKGIKSKDLPVVVLDGCPFNCAEVIMGRAGIRDFIHLNTTDFDIIKGKTPVTEDKIKKIAEHMKNLKHENN
jgi:uncharacterized metal-binding protein